MKFNNNNDHIFKFILYITILPCLIFAQKIVLVPNYEPHIECKIGESAFKGVDYEFFKDVMKVLNMSDIQFECEQPQSLLKRIYNNESNVLCAIGGITIYKGRMQKGYKFTTPYFDSGVSLLVQGKQKTWAFLNFFAFDFLLSWAICAIVSLSCLIWWLDGKYLSIVEYLWHSTAHLFVNGAFSQRQSISRLLDYCQLIYSVLFVIIFSSMIVQFYAYRYEANLITSEAKAVNKRIGTFPGYSFYVEALQAKSIEKEFYDQELWYDYLNENTNLDGLILDDTFIQIMHAKYPDLYVISRNFMPFGFGIMFTPNTSDEIVNNFNKAIITVNEKLPMIQRFDEYIELHYQEREFSTKSLVTQSYGLTDFYEIWLIYAYGLGISLFLTLLQFLKNKLRSKIKNKKNPKPNLKRRSAVFQSGFISINSGSRIRLYDSLDLLNGIQERERINETPLDIMNKKDILRRANNIKKELIRMMSNASKNASTEISVKAKKNDTISNILLFQKMLRFDSIKSRYSTADNAIGVRERTNKRIAERVCKLFSDYMCNYHQKIKRDSYHIQLNFFNKLKHPYRIQKNHNHVYVFQEWKISLFKLPQNSLD